MKRLIIATLAIGALLSISTAKANRIFDFNYSGGGYTASGEFTTGDAGSPYTVKDIAGTADGFAITGLSSYAASDQLLYFPLTGGYYADFGGISFAADGVDYNITNYPSGDSNFINISTLDPSGEGCCGVAVNMSVSAVPEPASMALLGVGLTGFGLILFIRRKRSAGKPSWS